MSTRTHVSRPVPSRDQRRPAREIFRRVSKASGPWLQAAWGLLVALIGWSILWRGLSLVPSAEPALAVAGTAFAVVVVGGVCVPFYVSVWTDGRIPKRVGILFPTSTKVRPFVDASLTVLLVWLALSTFFSLATTHLDDGSLAASGRELSEQERFYQAGDLYLWHIVDATLQFIGATDALNWKEPVGRYSTVTGVLLALFKALVIAPGLVVAHRAWTNRDQAAEAKDRSEGGPPVAPSAGTRGHSSNQAGHLAPRVSP
jgi:hypothetical protein